MRQAQFVVVSGLPGSGKSTVGSRIAPLLGLEMIDKDAILEGFFGSGDVDPEERNRLSRQADHALRKKAEMSDGAVLVSHWRRPELSSISGTPTDWLGTLPGVVEVYCRCSPATAARRFLERTRHAAHGDDAKNPELVLEQFHALDALGPLGIGKQVTADTEHDIDVIGVVKSITRR